MELKFYVKLRLGSRHYKSNGGSRLEIEAGGVDELWCELADRGIFDGDVERVRVMGLSDNDKAINDSILKLSELGVTDLYASIEKLYDEYTTSGYVYMIPSILPGGIVEFQISDGPCGDRGESLDVYCYSEAKILFDKIVKHGWYKGARM